MLTTHQRTVNDLFAGQWGLLTTAQAVDRGVSRMQLSRMESAGLLDRVAHGIYASPAVRGDELLDLRAAWLSLSPKELVEQRLTDLASTGVVSHASAARLHRIGDLIADEHEFLLTRRVQSTRVGLRVRRARLEEREVTLVAGLPVTTAARTIVDLRHIGTDPGLLGDLAADAARAGLIPRADSNAPGATAGHVSSSDQRPG
ncbi:type IV toxin-antitoxin system AbiEi family antitoxin domain-containing protein [Cellulomonas sp. PhB150]|uniref:type IV toxin-antitoxin system AbiEi family antitoxin domain-containing protein n=1 Tax=Cellulomonas sp. PhB150 TaxID=2485188 RepID=UPI000F497B01|nr:type IV toxin-antitoxin system AbiEi family antitoxin domain-containing protein [Cellulomonas sp. PhB150]ROS23721.1 putative AbiEi antitoxin of type IV toxin-antitoxin system [Cellulomonas sp. PhB150]